MSRVEIQGRCDPAFQAVADAFRRTFDLPGELGGSVSVVRDGRAVVDLWAGHADAGRPWAEDTLVNVWSTTKGVMALCIARLNDQGLLRNDRPVAEYWPEFAAHGKGDVTVAQLFSHQAGLCGPGRPVSEAELLDTDVMADLLAAEPPHWPPGGRSGYHALSIGPLADGLVRRVAGKTVGAYFRDEIGGPSDVDFHMGLHPDDSARVAEIAHDGRPQSGGVETFNAYQRLAQVNIPVEAHLANLPAWRAQGTPSAAGQGNARSIARLYGALATDRTLAGRELVSAGALGAATTPQIENEDLVLRFPIRWGVGFALNPMGAYGPNAGAFGHHGWGGSFGFADPAARLGVGYAMNFMREPDGAPDPRMSSLVEAVYACA